MFVGIYGKLKYIWEYKDLRSNQENKYARILADQLLNQHTNQFHWDIFLHKFLYHFEQIALMDI